MPDCSPFWYTIDTMQALHGYDYHAFELFGPVHLFWLGLCAALCVGGSLLFRRLGQAGRRRVLAVLTVLLLADELLKGRLVPRHRAVRLGVFCPSTCAASTCSSACGTPCAPTTWPPRCSTPSACPARRRPCSFRPGRLCPVERHAPL